MMRTIYLFLLNILEAEPGIEPRSTALQAVDVYIYFLLICMLCGPSGNPLLKPTL